MCLPNLGMQSIDGASNYPGVHSSPSLPPLQLIQKHSFHSSFLQTVTSQHDAVGKPGPFAPNNHIGCWGLACPRREQIVQPQAKVRKDQQETCIRRHGHVFDDRGISPANVHIQPLVAIETCRAACRVSRECGATNHMQPRPTFS